MHEEPITLLEKFFSSFNIEPMYRAYSEVSDDWHGLPVYSGKVKYFKSREDADKAHYNIPHFIDEPEFPTISDKILIELICISLDCCENSLPVNTKMNRHTLEKTVLTLLIIAKEDVYNEVRKVFDC